MPTPPGDPTERGAVDVEQLTEQALSAAARGEWDLVAACYAARGRQLPGASLTPQLARQLLDGDAAVAERAALAQAAIGRALAEARVTHRQWRALSHQVGDGPPVGGRINRRT